MTTSPSRPPHLQRFWELTPGEGPLGVVWGNCQAESIRRLVEPAAAGAGVEFVRVPPVHEVTEEELAQLTSLLPDVTVLLAQPVRNEYRIPGCGTEQVAAGLGPDAMTALFPVTYFEGLFPYQVYGRDAAGEVVSAPLTDYHDVRCLAAAGAGWSIEKTLDWWRSYQPPAEAVRSIAEASRAELRRREADLDVTAMAAVDAAGAAAMHTVNHPANAVIASVAGDLLGVLGYESAVDLPPHEMLGTDRTPLEAPVLAALQLQATATDVWSVAGRAVPVQELVAVHLSWYDEHPDIVAASASQHRERLAALGLPT